MTVQFDDHVITTREVQLPNGRTLPAGTHGFVVEVFSNPEGYEVEFDLDEGEQVLARVSPDDFGVT